MAKSVRIIKDGYLGGALGDTVTVDNDEYLAALHVAGAVEDADGPNSLEVKAEEPQAEPEVSEPAPLPDVASMTADEVVAAVRDGTLLRETALSYEHAREKPRKSVLSALGGE